MMKYKDYVAQIEYDDSAKIFHGQVVGIKDVITFQGTSVEELRVAFSDSVDDYLAFCKERGEAPNKPYSGKFNIRISPELHAKLDVAAKAHNESINSYVSHTLEKAVGS